MLELGELVRREAGREDRRACGLGTEMHARSRVDVDLAAGSRLLVLWLHVVIKGHLGHAGVLLHEGVHLAVEGRGGTGDCASEALLG